MMLFGINVESRGVRTIVRIGEAKENSVVSCHETREFNKRRLAVRPRSVVTCYSASTWSSKYRENRGKPIFESTRIQPIITVLLINAGV